MGCLPGGGGAALHCWPWGPGGGLCGGCLWGGALYLPWVVSLEGEGLLSTADPGDREGVSVGAASGAGHHNTYHGLSPWRGRGCPPLLTLGTGRGSLWGLPLGRGIIIPTMGCLPGGEGAALHCWPWGPGGGLCGGCLWGGASYLPWVVSLEGEGLLSTADPGDREGVSVGTASVMGHHNTGHAGAGVHLAVCPIHLLLWNNRYKEWSPG